MNPSESPAPPAPLVLDTNAALDWLVFNDVGMAPLAAAIQARQVTWMATPRMREELLRTLSYPALAKWKPDCERTLTAFDRWTVRCAEPERSSHGPLLCSDPDDQVFIDLAVAVRARWLVTHDRALHRLKRPAARLGVQVLRPGDWVLPAA
jgi:predicted nucleic acid-binding protein